MDLANVSITGDPMKWNGCRISPPPPALGTQLWLVGLPYTVLFLVGTLGNTAVLTYVLFLTRSLRSSVAALGNTIVYIVGLSLVDLLVIMSIPFHVTTLLMDNWIFGLPFCKLYWILEMSNKICSTFILTAMAFDRYMAICHPEIKNVHRVHTTLCIMSSLIFFAVILVLPVAYSAKVAESPWNSFFVDESGARLRVVKKRCLDGLSVDTKPWVFVSLFLLTYIIPGSLLAFFYGNIIIRVRKQTRSLTRSRIPIRRITAYTLLVALFYFLCQTPFWASQVYGTLRKFLFHHPPTTEYVVVSYICHMFPFAAAALNWILYAQLNTQFKKGLMLVSQKLHRKHACGEYTSGVYKSGREEESAMERLSHNGAFRNDDAFVCPNCSHSLPLVPFRHSYNGPST